MTPKTTPPRPGGLAAEAYVGRPHPRTGLFYAACAREWDTDICGCPLCRRQAIDPDELDLPLPRSTSPRGE